MSREKLSNFELKAELNRRATDLGFVRLGVARAEALEPEGARLRAWLADGRHGQMAYMERTVDVRCDPGHEGMLPGALSVVVLATSYGTAEGNVAPPGRMARYARNRDYHNVLHKRLRKLTVFLREHGHTVRAAVDSMPVFERAWAVRAGLGFVGKNCCLIVPGLGSHVFLSALITSASLPEDSPVKERCGSCRACLDACPTQAFSGPRELDSRKCISYLTIEQRGTIDPALRAGVGDWIFGCDACQDVCPFNKTQHGRCGDSAFMSRRFDVDAEDFLAMDERSFEEMTLGSPLRRTGREGMARNAAVVLGNRGGRRHLPMLTKAAVGDDSAIVREVAQWATSEILSRCSEGLGDTDKSNSKKGL